ncbi:dipeptidase [Isachenkonia alkalipeptolytica]|uniref:Membrane dipeptidase n=1 Tax=Isachenkonia alkalipeptolytica TaxID=2565777 RepID=A0AA44BCX4_9CLOT|nr:dipeptidase [Isachenkonia alkalipeptolytica]NBG87358.1 membrane dipeptidase [Isachenkonia alkalipeptolytica]
MKVIDFHCDTMLRIMDSGEGAELKANDFQVDIGKLKQGKVLAQFFALFFDLKVVSRKKKSPFDHTMEMLQRFEEELKKNPGDIALAKGSKDLLKNEGKGKISAFLTIEEGEAIEGSLDKLSAFHQRGVRLITLTWNHENQIGFPNIHYQNRDRGLKPFGKEVIEAMNHLGMLIDVSHLSDGGFWDVAEGSKQPFIASHSNARTVKTHPRNLSDEMLRALGNGGGVTGLNFAHYFLSDDPISKIEAMLKHMRHIINVAGIEALVLGSDFDGISSTLEIQDMGEIQGLIAAMEKEGFSSKEIEYITHKNGRRMIHEVLG